MLQAGQEQKVVLSMLLVMKAHIFCQVQKFLSFFPKFMLFDVSSIEAKEKPAVERGRHLPLKGTNSSI